VAANFSGVLGGTAAAACAASSSGTTLRISPPPPGGSDAIPLAARCDAMRVDVGFQGRRAPPPTRAAAVVVVQARRPGLEPRGACARALRCAGVRLRPLDWRPGWLMARAAARWRRRQLRG
jgi:hypothetical protein